MKWTAPKAEGSLADARGDISISHDYITMNSSSTAIELNMKVLTSYPDEDWLNQRDYDAKVALPLVVEGVELDMRMRGFEFFSLDSSFAFDSLRPVHLKATGRIKFQGNVAKTSSINNEQDMHIGHNLEASENNSYAHILSGDVSISGLKINQLMLAPQLAGVLSISNGGIKVCVCRLYYLCQKVVSLTFFLVEFFFCFVQDNCKFGDSVLYFLHKQLRIILYY